MTGPGTLTVTGLSTLSGGRESGSGTTFAEGGAAFTSSGFGLDGGRTLELGGSSTATGTYVGINLNDYSDIGAGVLTIDSGATFDDQTTSSGLSIYAYSYSNDPGSAAVVQNQGTFIKSGSAATSVISTTFDNTGTVEVDEGTLAFSGVVNSDGTIAVHDGATIKFENVTAIAGGSLNDYGTVEIASNATISAATVNIGNDGLSGGEVVVDGGQRLTLRGGALVAGGEYVFGGGFAQAAAGYSNSVLLSGIGIGELNGGDPQVTLTIEASSGTLNFVTTNNLTIVTGFDGSGGTIEVTGLLSDVSAALLNGFIYSPVGSLNTLTMTLDDGSGGTAFRIMSADTTQAGSPVVKLTDTNGAIRNAGQIDVTGDATLSSDVVFNDLGTVKIETDQTLTLDHSGILGGSVNDSGTIEVASNSTLNAVTVNIANDGQSGGEVVIDGGQRLVLRNGATITGGQYIFGGGFAKAAPTNSVLLSGIGIGDLSSGNPQLTLTIEASGTLHFMTMTGLTVVGGFDGSIGTLEVTGSLSNLNAALSNGIIYTPTDAQSTLTFSMADGSGGTAFRVMSVDTTVAGSPVVALSDTNGAICNSGLIDVTGDATLSSDVVFNDLGTVKIEVNQTLTLKHSGILGGTVDDDGTIDASNGTFNGATVSIGNNGQTGGQVVIDSGQKLTLRGGSIITGGALTFGTAQGEAADSTDSNVFLSNIAVFDLLSPDTHVFTLTITASGGSVVQGLYSGPGGTTQIQVSGTFDEINTLLANGITFIPSSDGTNMVTFSVTDEQGDAAFKEFSITTGSGVTPVVQLTDASGAIRNNGLLDIAGDTTLSSAPVFNEAGTVNVEANQTLTLEQNGIFGGTINDYGTVSTAAARINDANLNIADGGQLTVGSGQELVLADVTVANNGGISGGVTVDGTLSIEGTVTLNGLGTVTLNDATISGTGGVSLVNNGNTIIGTGQIGIGNPNTLHLYNSAGTIEASGGVLEFETNSPIENVGTLQADTGAVLKIYNGKIDNAGDIVVLSGGVLTIANPVSFGSQLLLMGDGTVSLEGGTISGVSAQAETFINDGNTISGYGNIGTGASSGIELDVENSAGKIEATGGTLIIKNHGSFYNNAGATLSAATDGTLAINISALTNDGDISVLGTFEIDNPTSHGNTVTLSGAGTVTLTDGTISSTVGGEILTNAGNTISGYGQIGDGFTTNLHLVNASGVIQAMGGTLLLHTGNTIINDGVLKAMNGGTLRIKMPSAAAERSPSASGLWSWRRWCAADVLFSTDANAYGTLVIDHAADYTGAIHNFAGTGSQSSDAIDLKDIAFQGATISYSDDSGSDTGGTLTIYDVEPHGGGYALLCHWRVPGREFQPCRRRPGRTVNHRSAHACGLDHIDDVHHIHDVDGSSPDGQYRTHCRH